MHHPANLQQWVDYCMCHAEPDADGRFNMDEKWFFVAEIDKKCYLLPDEDPEYRTCKHKSHIDKVMFWCCCCKAKLGSRLVAATTTSCHTKPRTDLFVRMAGLFPCIWSALPSIHKQQHQHKFKQWQHHHKHKQQHVKEY
jgi:hypothetical protein